MPSAMTNATVASVALSCVSNVLAQLFEAYRDELPFDFDLAQFLRFVIVSLLTAPPNYLWQQYLERKFPAYERKRPSAGQHDIEKQQQQQQQQKQQQQQQQPQSPNGASPDGVPGSAADQKLNLRNTFAKWFIDCFTVGALFNTVAFFALMGLLKRQPLDVIAHSVRTETIPLIVAGFKIWPFASIISFTCVPVERRIVFLNFVGLLWGVYLSLIASRV